MAYVLCEGKRYPWTAGLRVQEARQLKRWTGLTVAAWAEGLEVGDPDAMHALVCLARQRAGAAVDFEHDDYDLEEVDFVEEEKPAPDPTPVAPAVTPSATGEQPNDAAGSASPAGTTSTPADAATSAPSRTS